MKTVMACLDFSDTSSAVKDAATRLADAVGAKIVLLHVDPIVIPEMMGVDADYVVATPPPPLPLKERPAWQQLQKQAAELAHAGHPAQAVYDEGSSIDRILAQAAEHQVDTLVMGSHGHGALYHLVMGSVTEGVLRKIDRPVLVVPVPKG